MSDLGARLRGAASALALALATGCAALPFVAESRLELGADVAEAPLTFDGGVPLVEVMVGGRGPFLFKLDTGSGPTVVAEGLAARLALPVRRVRGTLTGANGQRRSFTHAADIAALRVGDGATWRDVRAIVLPDVDLDVHDARRPVEGILGFAQFLDCTVTLDYQRRKLTLSRTPIAGGDDVLPLAVEARTPRVTLTLEGKPLPVLVDTGNDQGLIVDDARAASLTFVAAPAAGPLLATVSGMTRVRVARLAGAMQLGPHTVPQPLVSLMPCNGPMLGAEVLQHFVLELDARHRRARFARSDPQPIVIPPRTTDGLGLRRVARGWEVIDVIPGSPAAVARIRVGDIVRDVEPSGEGRFRVEVGQHGVYRELVLESAVLVR